jgi:hypothetical protein
VIARTVVPTERFWTASGAVLVAVLAVSMVYRAATQSVVYDEAFTYLAFLSGRPSRVFTGFTANNHVLFSALARVSIGVLGLSAFSLRLPTLVFGGVLLWTTLALCRRVFGGGALAFLATAALTLNPFVLDFLVAARGYGAALALFMVGLSQLTRAMTLQAERFGSRWIAASVALGLSVSANLTFAVPSASLLAIALAIHAHRDPPRDRPILDYVRCAILRAVAPSLLTAAAILAVPLSHARTAHFSYGAPSLEQTALSLVTASLRYDQSAWPADPEFVEPDNALLLVEWVFAAPLLVLGALWGSRALGRNRRSFVDPATVFSLLATGTLVLSLVSLVVGHALAGAPYPFGRTGLYLIQLQIAAAAGLAAVLKKPSSIAHIALSRSIVLVLTLGIARFATEFSTTHFRHWKFDAGTADIVERLETLQRGRGLSLRVAVADLFAPSVEFYRAARGIEKIQFVSDRWFERREDFDFFVVSPATAIELKDGVVVFRHPVSEAVLMESRAGPRR